MNKIAKIGVAGFLALSAFSAIATPLNNSTGLVAPQNTINFAGAGLSQDTPLDSHYSALGATFSSLYYDTTYAGAFPNVSGPDATNFTATGGPATEGSEVPFTINFNTAVTDAAFVFVTNPSSTPSLIEALLNGVVVETSSVFTSTSNSSDFYGFTNSLFNEISIVPEHSVNGAALIADLQFNDASVPEPTSLALLAAGLLGLISLRKRSQKL